MGIGQGKKESTGGKATQGEFQTNMSWEASRISQIEKSEGRAWKVAISAACLTVLSWVGIVAMMPLKQSVPYVIRVDGNGVPEIVTAMNTKGVEFDEVQDKYWVASYVRHRESYDWNTLQDDYDATGLLSSPEVGKEYAALYGGETGLDKTLGARRRVRVKILSVVPGTKADNEGVATVRFQTTTGPTDGSTGSVQGWVATVAFKYQNPSLMSETFRLTNPLGFQVTSYRKDPEAVGGAQ